MVAVLTSCPSHVSQSRERLRTVARHRRSRRVTCGVPRRRWQRCGNAADDVVHAQGEPYNRLSQSLTGGGIFVEADFVRNVDFSLLKPRIAGPCLPVRGWTFFPGKPPDTSTPGGGGESPRFSAVVLLPCADCSGARMATSKISLRKMRRGNSAANENAVQQRVSHVRRCSAVSEYEQQASPDGSDQGMIQRHKPRRPSCC